MKLRALLMGLVLLLSLLVPGAAARADGAPDGGGSGVGSGSASDPGTPGGEEVPGPTGSSVPRIMLTSFHTDPGTIRAGESFRASFTVQNMSRTSRVNNIKIVIGGGDGGGVLPMSGSASTFISSIRAEHSVSREMDFRTMPSLEAGPHALTLTIEYEDANFNQLQSQEVVAIVVDHETRADTGSFQVMPDFIAIGQDASLSFSVNNLGRTTLHNVRATIEEGQAIAGGEAFIGNIEPGASGAAEMLVRADDVNFEPVALVISYEDSAGTVSTIERTFDLVVEEPVVEFPEEFPEEPMPEPGLPLTSPVVLGVLGALVAAALVVILLVARARRRRAKATLDDDMALLDGDPLVPADPR